MSYYPWQDPLKAQIDRIGSERGDEVATLLYESAKLRGYDLNGIPEEDVVRGLLFSVGLPPDDAP